MRNDFCTGYLAHSAKGKEWTKHKYVAKVKLSNGKYFYFYNMQQYQNYLKSRGDKARKELNDKKTAELAGKDATLKKEAATSKTSSLTPEEKRAAAIERVKGAKATSSSKKSGKGSSSSKKSTKSGSGKSSSSKGSSSKSSKEASAKEKSSSGSSKKSSEAKEKTTKAATSSAQEQQEQQVKQTPSLSSYKYQYDLNDKDIDTYSGAESDRVSNNRVQEIIDDMVDKYPDNASGYLLSSFSDSITYQFKWVKEGGTIKLIDPDTGNEVPADTSLTNSKSVSLFRTDDKKKKS